MSGSVRVPLWVSKAARAAMSVDGSTTSTGRRPWRNPSPKPATSHEAIGEAGQTKLFRTQVLAELERQHQAKAMFPITPDVTERDKDWDLASRQHLFKLNFPNVALDDVIDTWSPGTSLENAACEFYRHKIDRVAGRAWDKQDEWTRLRRELENASSSSSVTARAGMMRFAGRPSAKAFDPSPFWYRLADTPRSANWVRNAICFKDQVDQQLLQSMDAVEYRRRLHDHIVHRFKMRRRENLAQERRFPTTFKRSLKRATPRAPSNREEDRIDRLAKPFERNMLPDLVPEADPAAMAPAFQSVVKHVVPELNLHLILRQPLPDTVARLAKKHLNVARQYKHREQNDKQTARAVRDQIASFEKNLVAREQQALQQQAAEASATPE